MQAIFSMCAIDPRKTKKQLSNDDCCVTHWLHGSHVSYSANTPCISGTMHRLLMVSLKKKKKVVYPIRMQRGCVCSQLIQILSWGLNEKIPPWSRCQDGMRWSNVNEGVLSNQPPQIESYCFHCTTRFLQSFMYSIVGMQAG